MSIADILGFIGVSILLLAYLLIITNKLSQNGLSYLSLNLIGAGLAFISSILINYWPFIILEGVWTVITLWLIIKLFLYKNKKSGS